MSHNERILFDAGIFIGALLKNDPRDGPDLRGLSGFTYDVGDWKRFESAGLRIAGPESVKPDQD